MIAKSNKIHRKQRDHKVVRPNCLWHVVVTVISVFTCYAQTNLLDGSEWTIGTGSVNIYNHFGSEDENERKKAIDPFGQESIIWIGSPKDGAVQSGGWITDKIPIDHTKDYRISVWLKKTGVRNGQGQLGFYSRDELDRFTSIDVETGKIRPYSLTFSDVLPELDKWYLIVGYVYNSLYFGTTVEGGIYDPLTGDKIDDARNMYRFHPEAKTLEHFSFLYDNNTESNQFFFGPRIDELNPETLTIDDLLAGAEAPLPSELVFSYDIAGNNILRSTPQASIQTISGDASLVRSFETLQIVEYPPGYFDEPISEENRYESLGTSINIYPNPTRGALSVSWEEQYSDMILDVYATDLSGKAIPVKFVPETYSAELNLEQYPPGVYLIGFLINDGRQIEKKIIKK